MKRRTLIFWLAARIFALPATGLLMANEEALREARTYGLSRLEIGMKHFIQNFHMDGSSGESSSESAGSQR